MVGQSWSGRENGPGTHATCPSLNHNGNLRPVRSRGPEAGCSANRCHAGKFELERNGTSQPNRPSASCWKHGGASRDRTDDLIVAKDGFLHSASVFMQGSSPFTVQNGPKIQGSPGELPQQFFRLSDRCTGCIGPSSSTLNANSPAAARVTFVDSIRRPSTNTHDKRFPRIRCVSRSSEVAADLDRLGVLADRSPQATRDRGTARDQRCVARNRPLTTRLAASSRPSSASLTNFTDRLCERVRDLTPQGESLERRVGLSARSRLCSETSSAAPSITSQKAERRESLAPCRHSRAHAALRDKGRAAFSHASIVATGRGCSLHRPIVSATGSHARALCRIKTLPREMCSDGL